MPQQGGGGGGPLLNLGGGGGTSAGSPPPPPSPAPTQTNLGNPNLQGRGIVWGPGNSGTTNQDLTAQSVTVGKTKLTSTYLQLVEVDNNPDVPPAKSVRLFTKDNGGGKVALYARFPTGAIQQISVEP